MEYEHQPYPSYRFHRSGEQRIVKNDAEHAELELEGDWADTPAAFEAAAAPIDAEPDATATAATAASDAPAEKKPTRARKTAAAK